MIRLWGWIAAAFGLLGAALLLLRGQRDKARQATKAVKVELETAEATREVERVTQKAAAQSRQESVEVQREADDRPAGERPTGTLRR